MGADYAVESNYAVTRRKIPDADTGRIYPLNVHGIVYLTRGELLHIHILKIAAAICILGLVLVIYMEIRRRKRESEHRAFTT